MEGRRTMSIENSDPWARYSYRLDPADPCIVQRKANKPRATWQPYLTFDDRHTAKAKLLRLGKTAAGDTAGDA